MRNKSKFFVLVVIAIVALMLWNAFSQPGIDDFESEFFEVNLYRNENNTGPVERVYIVTTSDTLFSEMELYGKLMPYSKLGNTKVYFFLQGQPHPQKAMPGDVNFVALYNQYCLAVYEKKFTGETFRMFPFKDSTFSN